MKTLEQYEPHFETLLSTLKNQWEDNVRALVTTGILETFEDSYSLGIRGLDGLQYPVPEPEEIQARLEAKREILDQKLEQGFTKLLLVPFGIPLSKLTLRFKQLIERKFQEGKLISTDGTKLPLDTANPLYQYEEWTEDKIFYDIQKYDKQNHGGKTKTEILSIPNSAWQILLIQPELEIPAKNQGSTKANRKQLEAGLSPEDCLKLIQTDPNYQNETGLSPEAEVTLMLQTLENTDQVINDFQGHGKITRCFTSMFASGLVPCAYWNRGGRQAELFGDDSDRRFGNYGSRSSVRV
jgi:hypothetical protein